ncbi:MAG: histone deacetylase family protein [Deltaproteobacteria bacterium]|nr:histone deacetylase family protein [Deltaproteobacteria bacterium]
MPAPIPVYFHDAQLAFKPRYEWAFGEKIDHPETTARAESILAAVRAAPEDFERRVPREVPLGALRALHNYSLLTLYNTAAKELAEGETFSPMVFPRHRDGTGDPTNLHQAGAFCFDSGTPLARNTWEAAAWSAACARDAAAEVSGGRHRLTYALSRPPGHHATRASFGGYCYFANAAVAARLLKRKGRVAVVDIDFHHGNGTQNIFYRTAGVFTLSVHGDPREVFPYFAGYASETGAGPGLGFNLNIPLPMGLDGEAYLRVIDDHVLPAVQHFAPDALVLAAGFDTYKKDPVGHFQLERGDYQALGERFGRLGLPTVVVQEGGYHAADLGKLATTFLRGVQAGLAAS